ncbi:hypothetical protein THAOC_11776 [Thalassiosira oceanica]|uniref:Uncharacterized protein n=1 Tax=Thalassiosira oceanica TaxID=159749 RepID=K0T9N0_THAOC|nr:hypothetical protein THAOC_11776 [Thalassiosira oceanica]|eukprot:EJK67222.1 hypothetical protein THAOC_11776 [Thalassiosira oceanica]
MSAPSRKATVNSALVVRPDGPGSASHEIQGRRDGMRVLLLATGVGCALPPGCVAIARGGLGPAGSTVAVEVLARSRLGPEDGQH